MKVSANEHLKHSWLAHEILKDFRIEDVWRFPIVLQAEDSLEDFAKVFEKTLSMVSETGVAGLLFKLRLWLGSIFGWDEKQKQIVKVGSLRERFMKSQRLSPDDLLPPGENDFIPVYAFEKESLAEIENATVHAALHLSIVPLNETEQTIHMTIYVQPKGLFGQLYMSLIKPFRHWIIYPMILKSVAKNWQSRI